MRAVRSTGTSEALTVTRNVMTVVMRDDAELFMDNDSFKRWMTDTGFSLAYEPAGTSRTKALLGVAR